MNQRWHTINRWVRDIATGSLVILWLYASLTKIARFEKFLTEIRLQHLPAFMTTTLPYVLPAVEIVIAVGLLTSFTYKVALYVSLCVLIIFTLYIFLGMSNVFDKRPCSCGGILEEMGWTTHFYFNIAFIFFNTITIYINQKRRFRDR